MTDDTNPKDRIGRTKPPIHAIPPTALLHLGMAMANGVAKYGLMNWRDKRVMASVYYDAQARHGMSWWDGEEYSRDTQPPVHHLAHIMACCAILIDAMETGNLIDDRPTPGVTADLIDRMQLEALGQATPPKYPRRSEVAPAPEPDPVPQSVDRPDPYAPKPPDDWTSDACMPGPDAPRPQRGLKMICGELFFEGKSLGLVRDNLLPSELDRLIELVDAIDGHPYPGQDLKEARAALDEANATIDQISAEAVSAGGRQ